MTTQFASASYQEIIDLKTTSNNVSIIGLHTPTSMEPYKFLNGFFQQFKRYRYNGMSMALVPAARLPNDISQVGYGAGEAPVDARDILNPVLFHGCHGNAMGTILDGFLNGPGGGNSFDDLKFSPSTEFHTLGSGNGAAFQRMYEKLYYRALTDNTWLKANPQAGFRKRGMRPLVYDLSTNHPIGMLPQGHVTIQPNVASGPISTLPKTAGQFGDRGSSTAQNNTYNNIAETGQIGMLDIQDATSSAAGAIKYTPAFRGNAYFTSRLHPLGWIDTTLRVSAADDTGTTPFSGLVPTDTEINSALAYFGEQVNQLPLLYMGMIMLPPAYKANQYMRLILNHSFSFKGFRGTSTAADYITNLALAGSQYTDGGYQSFIDDAAKGEYKNDGFDADVL